MQENFNMIKFIAKMLNSCANQRQLTTSSLRKLRTRAPKNVCVECSLNRNF